MKQIWFIGPWVKNLKQFTTNADHPRHQTAKDGLEYAEYAI